MIHSLLPAPFSLLQLDSVGSTNDEARRLALSGQAADLLVVSAREQKAGRGRRGRVWVSPPGNLHCSTLIRIHGDLATAAQLGFVAAIALVDAFRTLVPNIPFTCKWPNDVLAEGRKCSGMLLEPAGADWLILGIGVDVAAAPPPGELVYSACALADLGFAGSELGVLAAFCTAFGPMLDTWRRDGFGPIRHAWTQRARGIGEAVIVRLDTETLSGIFAGLDEEGALLLDQPSIGIRRVLAGDVYFPDSGNRR